MGYTEEDITRAARTAIKDFKKSNPVWKDLTCQDQEDAEQEAMIDAWKGFSTFDADKAGTALPVTRAITLAKYAIMRHVDRVIRGQKRNKQIFDGLVAQYTGEIDSTPDALDQLDSAEMAMLAAEAAGRQFPTQISHVLRLRFGLHKTEPHTMLQISQVMKISLTDVYRYYNDGLQNLRAQMQVDKILAEA